MKNETTQYICDLFLKIDVIVSFGFVLWFLWEQCQFDPFKHMKVIPPKIKKQHICQMSKFAPS